MPADDAVHLATTVAHSHATAVKSEASSEDSPSLAFLRAIARATGRADAGAPPLADVDEPDIGHVLGDRFELRRRLGAGGFGIVFEAWDRARHAVVALKLMRRRDPGALYRFKQEFRTLAEVVHPNLAQLYELCADGETWWFTMELVEGVDAATFVDTDAGATNADRVRQLFRGLTAGIAFLHDSGKLHRDVKPSNVMVTHEGRVVLLDFGLVADPRDLPANEVAGTRPYMAPESESGAAALSPAADWYAVGVMLYEALAGVLPFDPAGDLLAAKRAGPTRPPSAVARGVPGDLERLCLELLAPSPAARPDAAEIIARLAIRASPHARVRREVPFVAREVELGALEDALASARRGRAVVALVHGASGAGRSALIQRFAEAHEGSSFVLAGRCFAQESVPFKALDSIVDALCRRLRELPSASIATLLPDDVAILARVFPVLRQLAAVRSRAPVFADGDIVDQRRRAFAALRMIMLRVADETTPVLVLDDAQWGDTDGFALLLELLRPPQPVLVVLTYRTEDAAASVALRMLLEELSSRSEVEVRDVGLRELDAASAAMLARAWLGESTSDARASAIAEAAHRHPVFIAELCQNASAAEMNDGAAAANLDALFRERVDLLPAAARRLLEVSALAGRSLPRRVALEASTSAPDDTERFDEPQALAVLLGRRLLRSRPVPGGEDLSLYHPRIGEVVAARMSSAERMMRHLGLARALEETGGAEPELVYAHFRDAGEDACAARYAREAAAQAREALAFERAARLTREALALGSWSADERGRLRASLSEVLAAQGRPREAADAWLAAADDAPRAEALTYRRRAMEQLLLSGYTNEGLVVLDRVLRDEDMKRGPVHNLASLAVRRIVLAARGLASDEAGADPPNERDLLRMDTCWAAALGLTLKNPFQAADFHSRHLLLALRTNEPARLSRALSMEAFFTAFRGEDSARATELCARAAELAECADSAYGRALAHFIKGVVAILGVDFPGGVRILRESERLFTALGFDAPLERDLVRQSLAACLFRAGELRELGDTFDAQLDDAIARGNKRSERMLQILAGGMLDLVRDRPESAETRVDEAAPRGVDRSLSVLDFRALQVRVWAAIYRDRARDAVRLLLESHPALLVSGLLRSRPLRVDLHQARSVAAISSARGRFDPILVLARRDVTAMESEHSAAARAVASALRAQLFAAEGKMDAATTKLDAAECALRDVGMTLLATATQRRRGEWMGGETGRALRDAADVWMRSQGVVDPTRMTAMILGRTPPRG
ncbi:MAG: protein kinase [Polyangiaceae bacterium]|nr:protein kinase [Polyangiaceae bacterium]